jgi:hypothetical protein
MVEVAPDAEAAAGFAEVEVAEVAASPGDGEADEA